MPFQGFLNKAKTHTTRFFGSTLPSWKNNVREGARFLGTVIPHVRAAHKTIQDVNAKIQSDPGIASGHKKRMSDISRFADLGLSHANQAEKISHKVTEALS
jgi:hypothetical protein